MIPLLVIVGWEFIDSLPVKPNLVAMVRSFGNGDLALSAQSLYLHPVPQNRLRNAHSHARMNIEPFSPEVLILLNPYLDHQVSLCPPVLALIALPGDSQELPVIYSFRNADALSPGLVRSARTFAPVARGGYDGSLPMALLALHLDVHRSLPMSHIPFPAALAAGDGLCPFARLGAVALPTLIQNSVVDVFDAPPNRLHECELQLQNEIFSFLGPLLPLFEAKHVLKPPEDVFREEVTKSLKALEVL